MNENDFFSDYFHDLKKGNYLMGRQNTTHGVMLPSHLSQRVYASENKIFNGTQTVQEHLKQEKLRRKE
jgi:hypothetical protein